MASEFVLNEMKKEIERRGLSSGKAQTLKGGGFRVIDEVQETAVPKPIIKLSHWVEGPQHGLIMDQV